MNKNQSDPEIGKRVERAIGPIFAGMILDLADFMTFGPIGLYLGLFVGLTVGWYLAGLLRLPKKWRVWAAWLAGLYCLVPGTEFLPVATILGGLSRFFEPPAGREE